MEVRGHHVRRLPARHRGLDRRGRPHRPGQRPLPHLQRRQGGAPGAARGPRRRPAQHQVAVLCQVQVSDTVVSERGL